MKIKRFTILTLFLLAIVAGSRASNTSKESDSIQVNGRIVGLNCNPLLNMIVPFSVFPINQPAPDFSFRRLYKGHGIRTTFGLGVHSDDEFFFSDFFFHMSFGYTHKRKLHNNLYWNGGVELKGTFDDRNFVNEFFGLSFIYGVEYHINPKFSLSTEGALDLGAATFDFLLFSRPPIQITANFNITKSK